MRICFDVDKWSNKPFNEFTNEELLEYWYKMRLTTRRKEINSESSSGDLYTVSLQSEIIQRMKK